MIVVWGSFTRRRVLGYVADYCVACGAARPFVVNELRRITHIYAIPLGKGRFLGHERVCETCRDARGAALRSYATLQPQPGELGDLADATNPGLLERAAEWQEVKARAQAGRATREERLQVVVEALVALNPPIQARAAQQHLDLWGGLALLATVLVPSVCFIGAFYYLDDVRPQDKPFGWFLVWLGSLGSAAAVAFLAWAFATDVRRYIRRTQREPLVKRLSALQPGREELAQALARMRSQGAAIGRYVDPDWLYGQLALAQMQPPA